MIALLSLFVPPLFLVLVRERRFKDHKTVYKSATAYAFAALGLNWLMMMLLHFVFGSTGDISFKLNTYSNFACKYMLLAMILAGLEPYAEHFARNRLELHLPACKDFPKLGHFRRYAVAYAILLLFLNFIRIFDNNFWADEAATLCQMRGSFESITLWAAGDVHPPLYYYALKIVYLAFGNQGWAFHALSLVPCLVIVILSLTLFWEKFGGKTSLIMMTFAGLSNNAVYYHMEVRMYSWAGLFVLLSFYMLWQILKRGRKRDYVLFALFSLGAAYTHYFAMVTVAFFYVAIMAIALCFGKLNRKAVLLTWAGTIAGYIPWVIKFLKTVQRTAKSYWVTSTPTFQSSVGYLFSSRFSGAAAKAALLAAIILFFLYETKIIEVSWNQEKKLGVSVSFRRAGCSDMALWVAAGILCALGTILFAISYSHIVRPVFAHRYIYAASVVAWMVLAIVVPRLKLSKIWTMVLFVYLLAGYIPGYRAIYTGEKNANTVLQTTLKATAEIGAGDIILANSDHMVWGIAPFYYPGTKTQLIELDEIPDLDTSVRYYLIVSGRQDLSAVFRQLRKQKFSYEPMVDDGNLGTHTVFIYKIEKQ